jgi:import inner membrane translocase subunit TIM13
MIRKGTCQTSVLPESLGLSTALFAKPIFGHKLCQHSNHPVRTQDLITVGTRSLCVVPILLAETEAIAMSDLASQLNQLTPQQKQVIMASAQQEANEQIMQEMMKRMIQGCFDKCAGTSGGKLDHREQSCLAACQDRYLATRAQVQEALYKRQGGGLSG